MANPPGPPDEAPRVATLHVVKDALGFSAAHFSILETGSETLHGHNYRVSLRARGEVRADGTLVDFAALKAAVRAECEALDHRMLVPTRCPAVAVRRRDDGHVDVTEGSRRFVFPEGDIRLLDVPNTTCECLAALILAGVRARLGDVPVVLEVGVEESPGQGAAVSEGGAPSAEPAGA